MDKHLKEQLLKAKPSLRLVSPITFWFMAIMGVFDLVLGTLLFFAVDKNNFSAELLIVNELFSFEMWGVIFIVLGLLKLVSLWLNNWKVLRYSLIIAVCIKAMWTVALVIRALTSPGTFLMAILWTVIAVIQQIFYIFFLPPHEMSIFRRRGKK